MISVCAIMKNEESALPQYLDCISKFADEIILVDNGSTDRSKQIALKFGCKVIDNQQDNFDLGRNLYIEEATEEWILSLDIDEFMFLQDVESLKSYLKNINDNEVSGFYLPSFQYYGEGKWATFYMCRLFRNKKLYSYGKKIHGSVGSSIVKHGGRILSFYAPIHHFDALISEQRNNQKRRRNISLLLDKDDVNSITFLAIEYFASKDIERAIELIQQAIRKDKDQKSPALLFYSQMSFFLHDYERSLALAENQLAVCKEKIAKNDSKYFLYYNMIDSCNVVIENSLHAMNQDSKTEEIILNQISKGYTLPHNYLNLYLLDPNKNHRCLDHALKLNPMLKDSRIYSHVGGATIYEMQTSILQGFDYNFVNGKLIIG